MIFNKKCKPILKALTLGVAVSFSCFSLSAIASQDSHAPEWGYKGDTGPQNWGKLSKDFSACSNGKNQSPINIDNAIDGKLPAIEYNYNILIADKIKNNGHTVQVDVRSGGEIKVDGTEFKLKQFHFHTPSENTIEGKTFPLEVHFVHASDDGKLAVIAMMYGPGRPDALLNSLLKYMPLEKGQSKALGSKDLAVLETDKKLKNYIRFNGSLTTPPCTEGVIWLVKKNFLSVSMGQLDLFHKALKHPNNRPVQAINSRLIVD
jgi:carbonic anhydrase